MDDIVKFCRDHSEVYRSRRKSPLTAFALDAAAIRIEALERRIAELEDERDLWKQSEETCRARYDKLAAELQTAIAMQTLLEIDGELYDAKGEQ